MFSLGYQIGYHGLASSSWVILDLGADTQPNHDVDHMSDSTLMSWTKDLGSDAMHAPDICRRRDLTSGHNP